MAARMPMEIRAPSKAGPAAVEAHSKRSRLPITISPFVPKSTNPFSSSRSTEDSWPECRPEYRCPRIPPGKAENGPARELASFHPKSAARNT